MRAGIMSLVPSAVVERHDDKCRSETTFGEQMVRSEFELDYIQNRSEHFSVDTSIGRRHGLRRLFFKRPALPFAVVFGGKGGEFRLAIGSRGSQAAHVIGI